MFLIAALVGAALLLASMTLAYWSITLHAPQYPQGLQVTVYVNRMTGDIQEIDTLNHYIGMMPLGDAAVIERRLAPVAVPVIAALLLASGLVRRPVWRWVLAAPALLFPIVFVLDLQYWLYYAGHNLDPTAPLAAAIPPFTPPALGEGTIAQFRTTAVLGWGFWMALAAGLAVPAAALVNRLAGEKETGGSGRGAPGPRAGSLLGTAILAAAVILVQAAAVDARTLTVSPGDSGLGLQAALDQAREGDTIRLLPGIYRGPVEVSTPVSLVGVDRPVIDGGGQGSVVVVRAAGVEISGLHIRNTGNRLDLEEAGIVVEAPGAVIRDNLLTDVLFGVNLKRAPDTRVIGNRIEGRVLPVARRGDGIRVWYSPGTLVEGNQVTGVRDVILWFSDGSTVRDNRVTHSRYGVHFMYNNDSLMEGNTLTDNMVGAFLMYSGSITVRGNRIWGSQGSSGFGIGLKDVDDLRLEDNFIAGNRVGIYFDNTPRRRADASSLVHRNLLFGNGTGILMLASVRANTILENAFIDNLEHVAVSGGEQLSENRWTVDGRGNYWSDYAGYDADGDGIGDLPYRSESVFERLTDTHPILQWYRMSPAATALELAARAFPLMLPRPTFTDEAPLTRPPVPLASASASAREQAALALSAGLMLMLPVLVIRWTGRRWLRPNLVPVAWPQGEEA